MAKYSEHELCNDQPTPTPAIAQALVNPVPNITPAALAQRLSRCADELAEGGRAYSAELLRAAARSISALLTAQPVVKATVPDMKDEYGPSLSNHRSYNCGWNACRAAMLALQTEPNTQGAALGQLPAQIVDMPASVDTASGQQLSHVVGDSSL